MTKDTLEIFVRNSEPPPHISQYRLDQLTDRVLNQIAQPTPSVPMGGWRAAWPTISRYGMTMAVGAISGLAAGQWLQNWSTTDDFSDLFLSLYSLPMGF